MATHAGRFSSLFSVRSKTVHCVCVLGFARLDQDEKQSSSGRLVISHDAPLP